MAIHFPFTVFHTFLKMNVFDPNKEPVTVTVTTRTIIVNRLILRSTEPFISLHTQRHNIPFHDRKLHSFRYQKLLLNPVVYSINQHSKNQTLTEQAFLALARPSCIRAGWGIEINGRFKAERLSASAGHTFGWSSCNIVIFVPYV